MFKILKDKLIKNTWQISYDGVIVGNIKLKKEQFLFTVSKVVWDSRELRNLAYTFDILELNRFNGTLDSVGI